MSKSRGNIVRAEPIREVMGADALRYFLLREIVFGQDGSFSYDALVGRYNSDLAQRISGIPPAGLLTMVRQCRDGWLSIREADAPAMKVLAEQTIIAVQDAFDRFEFSSGPRSRVGADRRRG